MDSGYGHICKVFQNRFPIESVLGSVHLFLMPPREYSSPIILNIFSNGFSYIIRPEFLWFENKNECSTHITVDSSINVRTPEYIIKKEKRIKPI